jgi:hypothetical protein
MHRIVSRARRSKDSLPLQAARLVEDSRPEVKATLHNKRGSLEQLLHHVAQGLDYHCGQQTPHLQPPSAAFTATMFVVHHRVTKNRAEREARGGAAEWEREMAAVGGFRSLSPALVSAGSAAPSAMAVRAAGGAGELEGAASDHAVSCESCVMLALALLLSV